MRACYPWSRIPGPLHRYKYLARYTMRTLRRYRRDIVAASIWGSVANNTYTLRSDLDLLVIYRDGAYKRVRAMLHDIRRHADRLGIGVDPNIVRASRARTGTHGISLALAPAIKKLERTRLRIGHPARAIIFPEARMELDGIRANVAHELDHMRLQVRRWHASLAATGIAVNEQRSLDRFNRWLAERCDVHANPFKYGVKFARRIITWQVGALDDDRHDRVFNILLRMVALRRFHSGARRLRDLDAQYDVLLRRVCRKRHRLPMRTQYLRETRTIVAEYLCTLIELLDAASAHIASA